MEVSISRKEQELIKHYKLTTDDLIYADLIVLDGLVIKDSLHPINDMDGDFSLTALSGKQRNIVIGCSTTDNKLRVYRNF